METKETAETTAPSVAPAKPAPKPGPGEPEPEEPVPSVPLSGLGDDSLEGLGAAFSGLSVGGPEGKKKEKEKQGVDMGVEEDDLGNGHDPSDGVPFDDAPPMATAVSEPVASSSTYTSIRESMPRCYNDDYHRPATGLYMTGIPGFAAPETGYTMPALGFTSLSGLRGPEWCGGSSRGSERS